MTDHPRCFFCGRPATCVGAELAITAHRCARCCNRDHGVTTHGPSDYLAGHEAAEGAEVVARA